MGRLGSQNPAAHDEPPPQLLPRDIAGRKGRDAGAPYIYVVQMDIPAAHEAEFNRVYDKEHAPMLSECCGGGTRYRLEKSNDSRMQKYMVIYEIASPAVLEIEGMG